MNDIAPGAEGGGPSTPMPTIEYEPVFIDVDSVAGVGQALITQSESVGTASGEITPRLKGTRQGERGVEITDIPVGGGDQSLTITQFAIRNTERMGEITDFLDSVKTGLGNLGRLTQALTAEFGSQDALNGADVNRVNEIIEAGKNQKTMGAEHDR